MLTIVLTAFLFAVAPSSTPDATNTTNTSAAAPAPVVCSVEPVCI